MTRPSFAYCGCLFCRVLFSDLQDGCVCGRLSDCIYISRSAEAFSTSSFELCGLAFARRGGYRDAKYFLVHVRHDS